MIADLMSKSITHLSKLLSSKKISYVDLVNRDNFGILYDTLTI